jgi:hypothetical protein
MQSSHKIEMKRTHMTNERRINVQTNYESI